MKKIKKILMPFRPFRGEGQIMVVFRKGLNWMHCLFSVVFLLASLALIVDQLVNNRSYFFNEGFAYTINFSFWSIILFFIYIVLYIFYRELRQAEKREWKNLVDGHY